MKALVLGATGAIGLMRQYTPMPTEAVAAAMIRLAKSGREEVNETEPESRSVGVLEYH